MTEDPYQVSPAATDTKDDFQSLPRHLKVLELKKSYKRTPWLRRASTCGAILSGSMSLAVLASYILKSFNEHPQREAIAISVVVLMFGQFLAAVGFICFLTLTGPIYKNQVDYEKYQLETWGTKDRVAGAVLLILILAAAGYVTYRLLPQFFS